MPTNLTQTRQSGPFQLYNAGMGTTLLEEGVLNFNKGMYFEAHESWEKLWRAEEGKPRKELIQGMIKIAAAFHHYLKGEKTGTAKLLYGITGTQYLTPSGAV